jgi:hypothetical protein
VDRYTMNHMLSQLSPLDYEAVVATVMGYVNNALGRAECMCCGTRLADAENTTVCHGKAFIFGREVACANNGGYWRWLGPERPAAE